jgi:hypothetical protein
LKLDPYLSHYAKINPKWTNKFTVRPETLKLCEENIKEILQDIIGTGSNFLDEIPKAHEIKVRSDKGDYTKLESST